MSNYAFIDSQNLNKSVDALGYKIDYQRFRLWLTNNHKIDRAIMYYGYMNNNKRLYKYLEQCGFELVFREVEHHSGRTKGNVDILMTINTLDHINNFDKGYLVTSDGDFMELVERLKSLDKFGGVVSPQSQKRCSRLLKKCSDGRIDFVPDIITKFGNKKQGK